MVSSDSSTTLTPEPFGGRTKRRILVVGPGRVLHSLIGHLSPADYRMIHGPTVADGVNRCAGEPPALIVLCGGPELGQDLAVCRERLAPRPSDPVVGRIIIPTDGAVDPRQLGPAADDVMLCSLDPDEIAVRVAQFFGERRRLPRAEADLRVVLRSGALTFDGRVKSVSARSVRVAADRLLAAGEMLQVTFFTRAGQLVLEGEVIPTAQDRGDSFVVHLLTAPGQDWDRYQRAVERMLRRQHGDEGTLPSVLIYDRTDGQLFDPSWVNADEASSGSRSGRHSLDPPSAPIRLPPRAEAPPAPLPDEVLVAPPLRVPAGPVPVPLLSQATAPAVQTSTETRRPVPTLWLVVAGVLVVMLGLAFGLFVLS